MRQQIFKCMPTLTLNHHVNLSECSFVLIELVFCVHSGAGHQLPQKPPNLCNQESRVKWSRSVPMLTCLQIRNSSKLGSLFSNFHFPTMSSIVKGFMPRDQSSENPKGRMNGNDFTLTKDHLLWHCDITTSSFTQISHITASGAVNWRTRITSWCFQDSSICLSFQQTGTCAVSRQVAQRYPEEIKLTQ